MTLAAGTRLGPYEILAPLGAGGMGEVYRARDSRLGRDVAVKVLPESLSTDRDALSRFEREARAVAALSHPNILAVYDFGHAATSPGSPEALYVVMELLEGATLRERLDAGPVAPHLAVELAAQAAKGLSAAHAKGIVHRDLKPENLFLTHEGHLKILDFGLAKRAENESAPDQSSAPTGSLKTAAGMVFGTPGYMSPEQVKGLPVDHRSDIFSLGVVLYELLSGKSAFRKNSVAETMAAILTAEPPRLPEQSGMGGLEPIIRHCLEKLPEHRFQSARDLQFALTSLATSPAPAAPQTSASIAVLPFSERSAQAGDDYFSEGLAEEIINALAQLPGLRVAARTSAFSFKGKSEDLRLVAEKLNVATILEGSVRRMGNRLRITVQLINAADGYSLWSERYDRELVDVFAIQDEIAGAIARKLKVALAPGREAVAGPAPPTKLEAYDAYLRGRAVLNRRGRSIAAALEQFEEAVAFDPLYAPALAGLADTYRLLALYGLRSPAETIERAREGAKRALELDPRIAEAHNTLAHISLTYDHDPGRALASWKTALEISPTSTQIRCENALWALYTTRGEAEAAIAAGREAVRDDPLNSWALGMLSLALAFSGRYAEAIGDARRAAEMDPGAFNPMWGLIMFHSWAGEAGAAVAAAEAALRMSARNSWVLGALGAAHARAGNTPAAEAARQELVTRSRASYVQPFWFALIDVASGRLEEAFEGLRRMADERDTLAPLCRLWLDWAPYRSDARFREFERRIGFGGGD